MSESRQIWNDGRYSYIVYHQLGGAPTPATDTVIGSGDLYINDDEEVSESYLVALSKWKNNKLVEVSNGNGTSTFTLYDDDNLTPLLSWVYTVSTKTRARAY